MEVSFGCDSDYDVLAEQHVNIWFHADLEPLPKKSFSVEAPSFTRRIRVLNSRRVALLHINSINSNYYFYDYDYYCAYYYQTCLTLGSVCNCCRPLPISTDAGPQLVDTAPVGCSFCFLASLGLSYLQCSYVGCKSIYMTKVFGSLLNRNQYMHEDRLITIFASVIVAASRQSRTAYFGHPIM